MEPDVTTRQQYWGDHKPKEAEASNTYGMPAHGVTGKGPDKGSKTTIPKTGEVDIAELFGVKTAEVCPDDNLEDPVTGEQPVAHPQAKPLSPRIDVSQKEPPKVITEKQAQHYALPSLSHYPLDSFRDVEKAASYFEEYGARMDPPMRREYCENLTKRASALGIGVSSDVEKYGSAGYAPAAEVLIAIRGRMNVISDEDQQETLQKLSEHRAFMPPDIFAATLQEFDKVAGIDHMYGRDILDPYYSTFGKTASQTLDADDGDNGSHIVGNDYVTNKQLKRHAHGSCEGLKVHYGDDFVEEYRKDPVGIFKSMPDDQKKYIARMANEEDMPVG